MSLWGHGRGTDLADLPCRESHNRILRDLAVLGYLGQLLPPTPEVLPLHSLIPYEVTGACGRAVCGLGCMLVTCLV